MSRARKKLCIVLPAHWPAETGGAEMQVQGIIQRITQLDAFDLHYVARMADPSFAPEGYSLHRIPARRGIAGTYLLDMRAMSRMLQTLRPDIVYQRVACVFTGIAARYAQENGKRMVWHVSSDRDLLPLPWRASWQSPLEQMNRRLIDYGARHASTVIVQNAAQSALLKKRFGRDDAVPISNFHPLPSEPIHKSDDRLTVCWIGNIKAVKRPELFVRLAMDFRSRSDVEFVMVGAVRAARWKGLIADIEKAPNLRFLGAQSQASVNELLARSQILVNTSVREGFPNTFIQAWLRRTAVLSMSANPDDTLDADRYGACAGDSYENLKSELERLLDNPELRREMGKRASEFARQRFSFKNIDRLLSVLDEDLDHASFCADPDTSASSEKLV